MKFISLIASIALILLINQDSTVGLPVDNTTVQNSCPEGSELIQGNCVPVDSTSNVSKTQSSDVITRQTPTNQGKSVTQTESSEEIAPCPSGMEPGKDGICREMKPIQSVEIISPLPVELTTELVRELTTEMDAKLTTEVTGVNEASSGERSLVACREGMRRNRQGVCKPLRHSTVTKVTTQPMDELTTELNTDSEIELTTELFTDEAADVDTTTSGAKHLKDCPKGMKRNTQGVCKRIRTLKTVPVPTQSTDDLTTELPAESEIELTTELIRDETADVDTTTSRGKYLKGCPKGTKRNTQGVCKQIRSPKTAEDDTQSVDETATESAKESNAAFNEASSRKEYLKDCPEGTERNEQGTCQKIQSASRNRTAPNLKALLKKDGSCPDDYKMIQGRCLYIKSEVDASLSPLNSQSNDYASPLIRPKNGNVELVPVLSDNSCPEGTEYSEYGLCQRRVGLPKFNPLGSVNARCQKNYQLVNGECLPRNTQTQTKLKSATPAIDSAESTSVMTESIDNDDVPELTTEGSDME